MFPVGFVLSLHNLAPFFVPLTILTHFTLFLPMSFRRPCEISKKKGSELHDTPRFSATPDRNSQTTNKNSRYELQITQQPHHVYYKDDGGYRNNHLNCSVHLLDHRSQRAIVERSVPVKCRLETENGQRKDCMLRRSRKKGSKRDDSSSSHTGMTEASYLTIRPVRPEIKPKRGTNKCEAAFGIRINDVSQNHHNQKFRIVIEPDWEANAKLSDIWGTKSSKILVKSKSPAKLRQQSSVSFSLSLSRLSLGLSRVCGPLE